MKNYPVKTLAGAVLLIVVGMTLGWTAWQTTEQQTINQDLYAAIDTQQVVEERIIDLPEDGGACSLTLFVHDDWQARPQERRLMSWFATDSRLASLKAQTHFTVFTPSSQMFRSRWSHWGNSQPAILLTAGDPYSGKAIYKKGQRTMPPTAKELGDQIARQLSDFCPRPGPKPTPPPVPITPTPVIPDIGPDTTPEPTPAQFPWGLMGGAVAAAVAYVLLKHFRTEGGLS